MNAANASSRSTTWFARKRIMAQASTAANKEKPAVRPPDLVRESSRQYRA